MKRLKFKNPLKGLDNAKKLIPESYKVDGKEFEMTDGNETYRLKWESSINEATVLTSNNKSQINEDMAKIKHLMGFKSQETLGTVKGAARLNENNKFNDILGKSKSLIKEGQYSFNKYIDSSDDTVMTKDTKDVADLYRSVGVDDFSEKDMVDTRPKKDIFDHPELDDEDIYANLDAANTEYPGDSVHGNVREDELEEGIFGPSAEKTLGKYLPRAKELLIKPQPLTWDLANEARAKLKAFNELTAEMGQDKHFIKYMKKNHPNVRWGDEGNKFGIEREDGIYLGNTHGLFTHPIGKWVDLKDTEDNVDTKKIISNQLLNWFNGKVEHLISQLEPKDVNENDVDELMGAIESNPTISNKAKKINTTKEKIETGVKLGDKVSDGDDGIKGKIGRKLVSGDSYEEEEEEEVIDTSVTNEIYDFDDVTDPEIDGEEEEYVLIGRSGEVAKKLGVMNGTQADLLAPEGYRAMPASTVQDSNAQYVDLNYGMPEAPSHEETDANQVYEEKDRFDEIFAGYEEDDEEEEELNQAIPFRGDNVSDLLKISRGHDLMVTIGNESYRIDKQILANEPRASKSIYGLDAYDEEFQVVIRGIDYLKYIPGV
jgi:hypothetical protein